MSNHKCTLEDIDWDGKLEILDQAVYYRGTCQVCKKEVQEWHSLANPKYYEQDEDGRFLNRITLNP